MVRNKALAIVIKLAGEVRTMICFAELRVVVAIGFNSAVIERASDFTIVCAATATTAPESWRAIERRMVVICVASELKDRALVLVVLATKDEIAVSDRATARLSRDTGLVCDMTSLPIARAT